MCRMTEHGARSTFTIPSSGRYLVCKGRHSGMEFYIPDEAANPEFMEAYHPLYAIRVKAKGYVELCT